MNFVEDVLQRLQGPGLHPALGGNRYCGPGALAIVTGLSTDHWAKRIRVYENKSRTQGTAIPTMNLMLRASGYDTIPASYPGWMESEQANRRPPLVKWAEQHVPGVYVVATATHWLVVDLRTKEVCDNMTVHPLPLAKYRRRMCKVQIAWRLEPRKSEPKKRL